MLDGYKGDHKKTPIKIPSYRDAVLCGDLEKLKRLADHVASLERDWPGDPDDQTEKWLKVKGSINRLYLGKTSFGDPLADYDIARIRQQLQSDVSSYFTKFKESRLLKAHRDCPGYLKGLIHLGYDISFLTYELEGARQQEGFLRSLLESYIEFGYDLDSKGKFGETLLHIAARYGFIDIINKLVQEGANLSLKDLSGRTPQQLAQEKGQGEASVLLVNLFVERVQQQAEIEILRLPDAVETDGSDTDLSPSSDDEPLKEGYSLTFAGVPIRPDAPPPGKILSTHDALAGLGLAPLGDLPPSDDDEYPLPPSGPHPDDTLEKEFKALGEYIIKSIDGRFPAESVEKFKAMAEKIRKMSTEEIIKLRFEEGSQSVLFYMSMLASYPSVADLFKELLGNGKLILANLECKYGEEQTSPLHWIAIARNLEFIKFLNGKRINWNITAAEGETPLEDALASDEFEAAKLIVQGGGRLTAAQATELTAVQQIQYIDMLPQEQSQDRSR